MAENIIQFYWPSLPDSAEDTKSEAISIPQQNSVEKPASSHLHTFEQFYRGRNDANLSSDRSLEGAESSFSISSLIRAATSGPRSSTPDVPCDTVIGLSGDNGFSQTETLQRTNKRQSDKPPYTYIAMCIMAIEASQKHALTNDEIREQLQRMFPFFRGSYTGWKESIRGCLYRSKYFIKVQPFDEPRHSYWAVDRTSLTPTMFKKQASRDAGHHYKEYLHEELGVAPICPVPQTPTPKDTYPVKNMVLPDIPCYQPSHTVTTETSESEDFLHARKDIGCEAEDKIGDNASSETNVIATTGKRKISMDTTETMAKKPCKNTTGTDSDSQLTISTPETIKSGHEHEVIGVAMVNQQSNNMVGYWNNTHSYGQHHGNTYQNYTYYPHYNQYNYEQSGMPAYYPHQWPATTSTPSSSGQTPVAMYNRQCYTPYHYNAMAQAAHGRYQTMVSGYNVAQHFLQRYQQLNTQNSSSGGYQWYSAPTVDSNALDLSTTSSEAD